MEFTVLIHGNLIRNISNSCKNLLENNEFFKNLKHFQKLQLQTV